MTPKRSWVTLLGVVVVGALVLAGAALLLGGTNGTLVFELDRGECFDLPADLGDELSEVDPVPCDASHEAEVVAVGELNPDRDLPYPGTDALLADVDARCALALADAPDASQIADRFGRLPVVPDDQSWETFEGRYVCVAIPFGGGTTQGSLLADRRDTDSTQAVAGQRLLTCRFRKGD